MFQKRCMVINDISGIGRCSLGAILPILAMFDIECVNVPTAVLSSSTAYSNFVMKDMSDFVEKYLKQYDELQLHFDGCMIGFLGNEMVVSTLVSYLDSHEFPFVFVDPIMGDNGKLYATYSDALVRGVQHLCTKADVITPNLTEFCALCDIPYDETIGDERLIAECQKLGVPQVVITGLERDGKVGNLIYDNRKVEYYFKEKLASNRCGTGDVFSAVIYGCLLRGWKLYDAVAIASDFVFEAVMRSETMVEDEKEGLAFEGVLGMLWKRIWQEN